MAQSDTSRTENLSTGNVLTCSVLADCKYADKQEIQVQQVVYAVKHVLTGPLADIYVLRQNVLVDNGLGHHPNCIPTIHADKKTGPTKPGSLMGPSVQPNLEGPSRVWEPVVVTQSHAPRTIARSTPSTIPSPLMSAGLAPAESPEELSALPTPAFPWTPPTMMLVVISRSTR